MICYSMIDMLNDPFMYVGKRINTGLLNHVVLKFDDHPLNNIRFSFLTYRFK